MKHDFENVEALRQLSKLFSPPIFKKIVTENDSKFFDEKVQALLKTTPRETSYLDLIKSFYKSLEKNYRCEYIYKNSIFGEILEKYGLKSTLTLNEFKVGESIADLVLLNGSAKIYEIKTELDGLDKLEKQIEDYQKLADQIYIVTDETHATQLQTAYKDSTIGIVLLNKRNKLTIMKDAQSNTRFFDFDTIFKVLRKKEYLELTMSNFNFIPDVPNTKIFRCCYTLLREVDIQEFQKQVVRKLKDRSIQSPNFLISRETPKELKYICNSLDLNEREYEVLYDFLNTKHLCTSPM